MAWYLESLPKQKIDTWAEKSQQSDNREYLSSQKRTPSKHMSYSEHSTPVKLIENEHETQQK